MSVLLSSGSVVAGARTSRGARWRIVRGLSFSFTAWILLTSFAGAKPPEPVTPGTIREARALLQYLDAVSGRYILSGQQEDAAVPDWSKDGNVDFDFIEKTTGKLPVTRGFDYVWFTLKPEKTGPRTVGRRAVAWARRGGVVQLCVHWAADLGSPAGQPDFYTPSETRKGTTFDIAQVTVEGTPENKEFLAKLARFAPDLQYLRDQHVPVIWRPFHEAGGTWFWWSAKGPEPFKKAWRYLYERMTRDYGLTNLLWCFNPVEQEGVIEAWYPGNDVVDIVSSDFYPAAGHPTFGPVYQHFRAFTGNRKVVLMSENGAIPDPDLLAAEGAGWASFCTWTAGFISDGKANTPEFIKTVYAHPRVLTLDEVPDIYRWKPGRPLKKGRQ